MKIVDRKTFLALPSGAIFQKFSPNTFGELEALYESWGHVNDYISSALTTEVDCDDISEKEDLIEASVDNGESFDMHFYTTVRDASFDSEQKFAVWERKDVEGLIARLQRSLEEAYPEDSQ